MINVLLIIFLTLLLYSGIATIVFIIFGQKESIMFYFGCGIVGLIVMAISFICDKINRYFKYSVGKRTILKDRKTGNKYKCKPNDDIFFNDAIFFKAFFDDFDVIRRFSKRKEWKNIPDLPQSLRNKILKGNWKR